MDVVRSTTVESSIGIKIRPWPRRRPGRCCGLLNAERPGHHCAIGEGALYIIGVWESEERVRARWASEEFEDVLTSVGFPSPKTAEITVLELHATEPPL
jgi:hypothetical protein